MEVVGTVNIAKEMVGKDLGEILGRAEPLEVTVTDNTERLFAKVPADVVIHTAGFRLKIQCPDCRKCFIWTDDMPHIKSP
jgi:hypothetical protein